MLVAPLTRDGAMPSPCDERERAGPGSGLAAWRLARLARSAYRAPMVAPSVSAHLCVSRFANAD
jgi:hypothetical protein